MITFFSHDLYLCRIYAVAIIGMAASDMRWKNMSRRKFWTLLLQQSVETQAYRNKIVCENIHSLVLYPTELRGRVVKASASYSEDPTQISARRPAVLTEFLRVFFSTSRQMPG
jgi:hypothetical protein